MDRVVLVSPFKGDTPAKRSKYKKYLRRALQDSIRNHDEAPFASHEMYTRALDDNEIHDRNLGMKLLDEWMPLAQQMVVYADFEITPGMRRDIEKGVGLRLPVVFRYINRRQSK